MDQHCSAWITEGALSPTVTALFLCPTFTVTDWSSDMTFLTIKQFCEAEPSFTEASLRWLIFQASNPDSEQSKFAPAIKRVSNRVKIDHELFIDILRGDS